MNGRKRHIIVDTQGLLLVTQVTAANVNDRTALQDMLNPLTHYYPQVKKLWADMGYQGQKLKACAATYGIDLEIVKRPRKWFWVPNKVKDVTAYLVSQGFEIFEKFKILPKRWIVERTFAWISRYRRMSKDYEFLPSTQETMIHLTMIRTMLKRSLKLIHIA